MCNVHKAQARIFVSGPLVKPLMSPLNPAVPHVGRLRTPPKRRAGRKLHLVVDADAGEIVASDLTAHRTHDCAQVPALLEQIADSVATVTADGAYDTKAVYEAAHERGEGRAVRVLIPPGRPDRGHRCRSRAVAIALPRRVGGSSRRIRVEIRLEHDTLLLTHLDEPPGVHHEQ